MISPVGKASLLFQEWARSKPIYLKISLSPKGGQLIIRCIGLGIYLTVCPGCEAWLNIPHSGEERRARTPEDALWGPCNCPFCETDMVIAEEGATLLRLGNPKRKRPAPPKPPKEKSTRSFRPSKKDWDEHLDADL
jgi:hypothetical protein